MVCDALLVDLDGTLVDSTEMVERTWLRWAHRVADHLSIAPEDVVALAHGRPANQLIPLIAPGLDAEAEAARMDEEELRASDGVRLLPGAAQLLGALDGACWAVVTSCSVPLARARMDAAGLAPPPLLITADMLARGKPDPEGYLRAAAELGVDPGGCVVLEDSPAGVAAGHAAGARVVGFTTTMPCAALRAEGAAVCLPGPEALQVRHDAAARRLHLRWERPDGRG